jgi:hypothetical protein
MDTHISTQIHVNPAQNKKKYRRWHRRTRAGKCAAAVRAVTGARLYLDGRMDLATAAMSCGSCVAYVRAAVSLLASENTTMLEQALRGQMPLLVAAEQMKRIAKLVNAYRAASAADRVMFARVIGPTTLFDGAVALAL